MVTNKDLDKKIGAVLEHRRKKRGITQEKIAERVGISVVYYRDIVRGKSRPNWFIWAEICLILGIDTNHMIEAYVKPELDKTKLKL